MKKIIFFSLLFFGAKIYAPLTLKQQQMIDCLIKETQDVETNLDRYIFFSILNDPERYVSEIDQQSQFVARSFRCNFQLVFLKGLQQQMDSYDPESNLNDFILFFIEQHLSEARSLYFSDYCLDSERHGLSPLIFPDNRARRAKYRNSMPALLCFLQAARAYRSMFRRICSKVSNEHSIEGILAEKRRLYLKYKEDTFVVMNFLVNQAREYFPIEGIGQHEWRFPFAGRTNSKSVDNCSMM